MFKNISSKSKNLFSKIHEFVSSHFVIPLIALLFITPILASAASWFIGPSSYKVYFVGDFNLQFVRASWNAIQSVFVDQRIDNISVELVKVDAGLPESAAVSRMIASQDDTIFVVGHFSSTASSHALYNYMLADPPIPVILPVESNPELGIRDSSRAYAPVFRLVPTDKIQAESAADFAEEAGAKRIWVIEDTRSNPLYTGYVSSQFIRLIQDKYGEKDYLVSCERNKDSRSGCATTEERTSGSFHARVVLRTDVLSPPSLDIIKVLDVDFVFFVGHEENCILVADTVHDIFTKLNRHMSFLAARGCELYLTKKSNVITAEAYMTHHVSSSFFFSPDYSGRPGKEAGLILKQIFAGVRQSRMSWNSIYEMGLLKAARLLLNWHRASDVRLALASEMEKSVERTAFAIEGVPGERYELTFRKNGDVIGKNLYVWRLRKPGEDARQADLQKTGAGRSFRDIQNANGGRKFEDLQKFGDERKFVNMQ